MAELDEPVGRHRWDPLTDDAEQRPISTAGLATGSGEDCIDPPARPSSDTTS